jgi:tetratricopeptide (TPR) repeat protein
MLGDFPAAQRYHEQSLVIAREVGNVYQETYTLMNLSRIAEIQGKAKEAVRYARDAVQLSKKAGDKAAEAWSYLYLGHAHALMHEVEQAKLAFEESLRIRSELGQVALATEPLAGLILLALEVQDIPRAKTLTDEVMHFLSAGATLDATEEPLRVYLACYNVLERMQDPRANQILVSAKQVLEEQTSKLKDEESRSMYIRNVPWRQAIEQAWLNAEEKS